MSYHFFSFHPLTYLVASLLCRLSFSVISSHLVSSLFIHVASYILWVISFASLSSSDSSYSLSSLLIPSQSHPYSYVSCYVFPLCLAPFISIYVLSFSLISTHPLLNRVFPLFHFFFCLSPLILSHPFSTASLHVSCNIFPLFLSPFIKIYLLSFSLVSSSSLILSFSLWWPPMSYHPFSSLSLFSYHFVPSQCVPPPLLSSDLLSPATYSISSHQVININDAQDAPDADGWNELFCWLF